MKKLSFTFLVCVSLIASGCTAPKAAEVPPAQEKTSRTEIVLTPAQVAAAMIDTQPAALSDKPVMLRVKGRITLADDHVWRVGLRTPGLVMVVYAGLGDYVKKGQVLARYHADEVREERAHYRAAQTELSLSRTALAQATRNRDRAQRLLELKAGSVQQLEQAQQDLAAAQAAVKKAEIEVDRGQDLLEDDLKVTVEPPPASAGEFADDVPILAPESGYVIEKNITPGKAVDLTTQTFVIGDLSKVWMLASVHQEDLGGLRVGSSAVVTLPGDLSHRFAGKITNLGQEFDPETRMMDVRIALDNPQHILRPEMLANAEIPQGQTKSTLEIPSDAVQELDNANVVFVNTGPGHFSIRPVRIGEAAGDKTPILEGIHSGENVVVHGSFLLRSQLLKSAIDGRIKMLNRIIDFTLAYRWLVLAGIAALLGAGGYALYTIPVEAFPDLTNNQVVVVTDAPSLPPTEVEQLVTYPIERAMLGLPNKEEVRSLSKLGLSMVTVVFDDSVSMYFARQLVSERLQQVSSSLPSGIQPLLGLPATAFGELYQYTLSGPMSAMDLKDLHEWVIKPQLRTIPGVSEVNAWGGQTKQFQIVVDPALLDQYGLTLRDVTARVEANNTNFGGGYIEHAFEQYTLVGTGRATTTEDLGNIVLTSKDGTPLLLRDVAAIRIGSAPPQGATLRNGETVSGMVIMLKGENGKKLIERIKEKISSLRLPAGVKIAPFYDQAFVIDGTINTVEKNLFEGFVLVTIVLLLFLGNLRAALITAAIIPCSMLISFLGMRLFGISANLMSLGAIDFGMIVDGAVVMMENSVHHLESGHESGSVLESVRRAAHEVARPMAFAVAIIIAVYMPILFLEGLEGRMFRPMAITVCAALVGSLFLALTMVPLLASFSFRKFIANRSREHVLMKTLDRAYARSLTWTMDHRFITVTFSVMVLGVALGSLHFIGTEFMPSLDEGSILMETRKMPGISLTESIEISKRIEQRLRKFPEIADVVVKIGRPDFATEAMGINEGDTYLSLRPINTWTRFHTKEALIAAVDKDMATIPGIAWNFTQPMAMRIDETISGIKADLAVKVFGEDFHTLDGIAQRIVRVVSSVRGAADPQMEITSGVAELSIRVDRGALARYGLNVTDVEAAVASAGSGDVISEVLEGPRRYGVALRLPERYRSDPDAMRRIVLRAPAGEQVNLDQVAHIEVNRGPEIINREEGQRRLVVMSNVRGRDLGSFVAEVRSKIERQIALPPGYFIEYGGQFENQERATRRLMVIVPVAIALIFVLLYFTFTSGWLALLVVANVPFALVGGVAALWMRGMNLNLSASIGFLALFGVAMLNGVVLVSSIRQMLTTGVSVREAVLAGARRRLRPVLMTACVASLGFVPMAIATSTGAEVQRPLATVVIGGLFSSTMLTLFLLPVIYAWAYRRQTKPVESVPHVGVEVHS